MVEQSQAPRTGGIGGAEMRGPAEPDRCLDPRIEVEFTHQSPFR